MYTLCWGILNLIELLSQKTSSCQPHHVHQKRTTIDTNVAKMQIHRQVAFTSPLAFKAGRCDRLSVVKARCDSVKDELSSRRTALGTAGAALMLTLLPKKALSAGKAQNTNVGSYLPKVGEGFVQFKPNETQTPVRVMFWTSINQSMLTFSVRTHFTRHLALSSLSGGM